MKTLIVSVKQKKVSFEVIFKLIIFLLRGEGVSKIKNCPNFKFVTNKVGGVAVMKFQIFPTFEIVQIVH